MTLALVGCQNETMIDTHAHTLTHRDIPLKEETPNFLKSNNHVEKKKTEEQKHPLGDIKVVSNPSGLLVAINKTNTLPTDYIPDNLVKPKIEFYFNNDIPKRYMREVAAKAVEKLFVDAYGNDMYIIGASGYRSYDRQDTIFSRNASIYGFEEANTFSAYPGQSEHQTGLTLDVTTRSMNYKLEEEFGSTKEGKWLAQNAHKYGFIIRYLKGKEELTGYTYEPWHIRYVGTDVADEIYKNNWTLEEYHKVHSKEQKVINKY